MTFIPYTSLTVTRGTSTTFTVSRGGLPTFTTYGHAGTTTDHVLLLEDGGVLLTESGDFLLTT